jgi:hypothetical protein
MDYLRRVLGPRERRAFRRAAWWGVAAFAIDFTFCTLSGAGGVMGVGYGAVIGWFGFIAGLVTGLMDRRRNLG